MSNVVVLPFNIEAEQAVIGAMLINDEAIYYASNKLTKLEFERKMLTILDTSSMKPSYATKTTSTASPVRSVIPQNIILDEEELTKEEIAEILSKMAGGNRNGSVMA